MKPASVQLPERGLLPQLAPRSDDQLTTGTRSDLGQLKLLKAGALCIIALVLVILVSSVWPESPETRPLPTCSGGWPLFHSPSHLEADAAWAAYITRVYGSIPTDATAYPWCMGDLWLFYSDELAMHGAGSVPELVGDCPTEGGKVAAQHYRKNSKLQLQAAPGNTTIQSALLDQPLRAPHNI